jgi:hypothetical protein
MLEADVYGLALAINNVPVCVEAVFYVMWQAHPHYTVHNL